MLLSMEIDFYVYLMMELQLYPQSYGQDVDLECHLLLGTINSNSKCKRCNDDMTFKTSQAVRYEKDSFIKGCKQCNYHESIRSDSMLCNSPYTLSDWLDLFFEFVLKTTI